MNKFTAVLNIVTKITKYGGIVYLVIQTCEFFAKGLKELDNPKKDSDV